MILSVLVGCFTVYRTFICKTPEELRGIIVSDDFSSFDNDNDCDDDFNQEKIFNDYGVVTTKNFDYISTVNRSSVTIPDEGDKQDVEKVETIPFPGKISAKEKIVLYTEEEYNNMNKEN